MKLRPIKFGAVTALFLLVQCFSAPNAVHAADYIFASISGLVEQRVGEIVLPKIYEKLGLSITINPVPANRAQAMATSGELDGEIMRIWTYGEENPTTIRVPTPYYQLETTAFIRKDSGIVIGEKSDLSHYRIAKVAGVKHTQNITIGLSNVFDVSDNIAVMKMVINGRVDVGLTNTADGLQVLKRLEYGDVVHLVPPLAILYLYHYVHQDHRELIEKVDAAIKGMKESGELAVLIRDAEQKILSK